MDIWSILGIEKTADKAAIRVAYFEKVSICNPEDKPEEFRLLRQAYEEAMAHEDNEDEVKELTEVDYFIQRVSEVYNDFQRRIKFSSWEELLRDDVCVMIDTGKEVGFRMLTFLMSNYYLPSNVWKLLDEQFAWRENEGELLREYPKNFIEYIMAHINGEYEFDYNELSKESGIDYDGFIRAYYKAESSIRYEEIYEGDMYLKEVAEICPKNLDLKVLYGKYYLLLDKVDDAIEIFNEVIAEKSDNWEAYYRRGVALFRKCKINEAYDDFKVCYENDPTTNSALYNMAECKLVTEEYEESFKLYKKSREIFPFNATVYARFVDVNKFIISEAKKSLELEGNPEVEYKLARGYYYTDNDDEACKTLESLYNRDALDKEDILLAKVYFSMDKTKECIEYLSEIVANNPKNGDAQYYIANSLNKERRYEEAVPYYEKALEIDPNDRNYLVIAGDNLNELKRYDDAIVYLDKAIKLNDVDSYAYSIKARSLCMLGRYDEAMKAADKALEIYNGMAEAYWIKAQCYLYLREYQKGINICNDAIENDNANEKVYFVLGDIYYHCDENDKAIENFNKAIEIKSNYAEAYNRIGDVEYYRDEYDKALESYNKAIEIYKKDMFLQGRGLTYMAKGEYQKAIDDYTAALECNPKAYYVFNNRGIAYEKIYEMDKAFDDYQYAIEINPDYKFPYNNMGEIYYAMDMYEEALERYNKAVNLDDESTYFRTNRGLANYFLKHLNEAREDFTFVIEADDKDHFAHYRLGIIERDDGNFEKARSLFKRSIELNEEYPFAYYDLGKMLYKLNEYDEAEVRLKKCISLADEYTPALEELCDLLIDLGKYRDSLKYLDRLIELQDDEPKYYSRRGEVHKKLGSFLKARSDRKKAQKLLDAKG